MFDTARHRHRPRPGRERLALHAGGHYILLQLLIEPSRAQDIIDRSLRVHPVSEHVIRQAAVVRMGQCRTADDSSARIAHRIDRIPILRHHGRRDLVGNIARASLRIRVPAPARTQCRQLAVDAGNEPPDISLRVTVNRTKVLVGRADGERVEPEALHLSAHGLGQECVVALDGDVVQVVVITALVVGHGMGIRADRKHL